MTFTTIPRDTDYTHYVEAEVTYGDITATPSAGDAFRCRAKNLGFKQIVARLDRDQDSDRSASVHSTALGRVSASFEYPMALAPSGNATTPTACDAFEFYRAHFGAQDIGAGHTTVQSGSTTSVLAGTTGAVTALGLVVGDFVVATTTAGLEARQSTVIATDNITVVPALTSAPTNGTALNSAVTYKLSKTATTSLIGYGYLDADFEHLCAGMAVADFELTYDLGSDTPEPMVKFSGPAARVATLATSLPAPTLQTSRGMGSQVAYMWVGNTKFCVTKLMLKSNNGQELRNDESCFMYPTGIKRTGNNGRYKIEFEVEAKLLGADVEGWFDAARTLTGYDVTVQIGNTLGNSVAFRMPNFIPDAEESSVSGDVAISLKGRCYGNGTDDTEITFCMF